MNLVSHNCCLTDLAFGFMPLERTDDSFLRYLLVPASLRVGTGGGGSQNIDSHVGRGSVHDDDGSVVEGAWFWGSTPKGKKGGSEVERGPSI